MLLSESDMVIYCILLFVLWSVIDLNFCLAVSTSAVSLDPWRGDVVPAAKGPDSWIVNCLQVLTRVKWPYRPSSGGKAQWAIFMALPRVATDGKWAAGTY